ncbi:hypothetical protein GF1_11640 [Desulfolithobacter dissulfuricans]|uniref:Uncharacterized protein n=1 Tax=Desulfolithobacter dissulfuricans TaxID=2795293 RepID=A0A915XK64_9BACT|nr:hypothetical protein [Desulfolithobacter dissulfuricans]BCO08788.1 hypothetical protein GF1_11640 [Desulfolithobacter dissulfuricans]
MPEFTNPTNRSAPFLPDRNTPEIQLMPADTACRIETVEGVIDRALGVLAILTTSPDHVREFPVETVNAIKAVSVTMRAACNQLMQDCRHNMQQNQETSTKEEVA